MMSEDERKQNIEFIIKDLKALNYNENFIGIIKETLDLYQKEKEKNRQSKMRIVQLEKEIDARIEDVNKYFISKEKIREKIKEIEENVKKFEEYWSKDPRKFKRTKSIDYYKLEALQELLEENNGKQM